jgi:hypothetical protein
MSGFGLYETLRIFVPGALAALILDFILRLGLASNFAKPAGSLGEFLEAVESPAGFAAVALLVGLLLYLVDLPSKLELSRRGSKDWPLPSTTLGNLLKDSNWSGNPLGLYIWMSDRYLHPETHKRIYLFGSLFRVYVDLRVLLAVGATLGPVLGLHSSPLRQTQFSWFVLAEITTLVGICLWMGWLAEQSHVENSYKKALKTHLLNPDGSGRQLDFSRKREIRASVRRDYRSARNKGLTRLGPLYAFQLVIGFSSIYLVRHGSFAIFVGAACLVVALNVWFWVEKGSPDPESESLDWRSGVFRRLNAVTEEPNFRPLQRLMADLCLFLPYLVAASIAAAQKGHSPNELLAWGALIVPCVGIMAFRKHESRLLVTYKEQSDWLIAGTEKIKELRETGALADLWNK